MNCIFCDIIEGKEPAEIIYEDELVVSFLDIRPINFGHTLVITKKHYENFLAVPKEVLSHLTEVTQKISEAVNSGLKSDGFNVITNHGTAAGQTVFHFHFHIIPRFKTDEFKFRPRLKTYDNGGMKEFADKIRFAVKN